MAAQPTLTAPALSAILPPMSLRPFCICWIIIS